MGNHNDDAPEAESIDDLERRVRRLERRNRELADALESGSGFQPTRRGMLGLLGGGALLAGASGSVAGASGDADIGNARFVGAGESLQYAVDNSRLVFVTSSYDSSNDSFPIQFDDTHGQVTVIGDGITQIGTSDVTSPVIEIDTGHTRPNEVTLHNLHVVGGDPGIRIQSTPFCELSNVNVTYANGHGIHVDDASAASNSLNLYNVTVENAASDGIHVSGSAHSSNFFGVRTIDAGRHGANLTSSSCVTACGCQFEDSGGYGLRLESVHGAYVYGPYLEGNQRDGDGSEDAEIYASNCTQFALDGGYGNTAGTGPRRSYLYVQDCHTVGVRNTRVKSGYDYLIDGTTTTDYQTAQLDCHRSSHYPAPANGIVSSSDVAKRVRSDGVLLSPDLNGIAGAHDGEIGVDDYSGNPKLFVWDDDDHVWRSADGDTRN